MFKKRCLPSAAVSVVCTAILIFTYQNCTKGFEIAKSTESQSVLSSSAQCLLPDGSALSEGEFVDGFTIGSAVYPLLCGQRVRRTCLGTGMFDNPNPVYSTCQQLCIHPQDNSAVSAGYPYSYYTKATGTSQADCDSSRVFTTCNGTTGVFTPAITGQKFSTCLVAGQTCAYTNGTGISVPTGNMNGSTVTGYGLMSATYPTLCGAQVTRTCQASGQWTGSIPVYTSCLQRCAHPDAGASQPIDANGTYAYYTRANGTAAECTSARVVSTCQQATGQFSPAVATTRFDSCVMPTDSTPYSIDMNQNPSAPAGSVAVKLTPFASGLNTPWGMTFLPDGRLLVTQKEGSLVVVSANGANVSSPISGLPTVNSSGQGGLLDIAIDPQFTSNRRVYFTFSESDNTGAIGTAVGRGELNANLTALQNVVIIFRQNKKSGGSNHYGSRLVFRGDGTLFVTLGERFDYKDEAPSLNSYLGKVVRINTDGTPAAGNPFTAQGGMAASIWSYGHRNPQAATLNPATGELWVAEHGPQGGDEVNLVLSGRNFGWPTVSYGCNYGDPIGTTCRYGGGTHNPPYTPPLAYWFPFSTAPGGIAFYTGDKIPEWRDNLFVGGMSGGALWRLILTNGKVTGHERLFNGQRQFRDVRMGPDGWLYVISRDANQIYRVERQ